MRDQPGAARRRLVLTVALGLCVLLLGLAVAWLYFPMREVLAIGGSCASGGPYEIATPCPEGSTLFLTLGLPVFFVGLFPSLFLAPSVGAPLPIFPAWALLFGALGWNFFDFALHGDPAGGVVASWLVCAVVFWLMALPGVVAFVLGGRATRPLLGDRNPAKIWLVVHVALLGVGWWLGSLAVHGAVPGGS